MIDPKCLGPDIDRSKISPDAKILGESYLTGPATCVEAGAVIENSRLESVTVAAGAKIVDSIVTVDLPVKSHRCDAAGRFVAAGTDRPKIGTGSLVQSSTLINSSVEVDSSIEHCWISNSHVGRRNRLHQVKMILCHCKADILLRGPTEFSESYLGDGLSVDRCGFFEAVFSNTFYVLDFDASTGRLVIREMIELPHTSQYGQNVICSTNSGRLIPEKNDLLVGREKLSPHLAGTKSLTCEETGQIPIRFAPSCYTKQPGLGSISITRAIYFNATTSVAAKSRSLGPRVRLWHDSLLSHELIRVEPCCWVSDWTKLIGESAIAYETDEAMMNDRRATLVMPFAVAGFQGDAARGLIMPGERAIGVRPHQRFPAWTFTYAPGAVIEMVRRVHDLLPPEQRSVADELVTKSIQTALAMVQAIRHTEQDQTWHDWADHAELLLTAHLEAELWRFEEGRACEWYKDKASGRWTHPRQERLLELAPDMLDAQVEVERLLDSSLARLPVTGKAPIPPQATGLTSNDIPIPSQAMGLTSDDIPIPSQVTRLTSDDTPIPPQATGLTAGSTPLSFTKQDAKPTAIDPTAQIAEDAMIGPGCQIGPGVIVGPGVRLWNATLEACEIGANSLVERCSLTDATIGSEVTLRSSVIQKSQIGRCSTVEAASIVDSTLADLSTVSALADLKNVLALHSTILGGRFESTQIETYLMSMHIAGRVSNVQAEATPVPMEDGRTVHVKAIPMIGGGARCDGTPASLIRMEGCFVGSNAQIEPGVRLGFGSFVLGQIGPDVELPPFTLAFGGDPTTYRLGEVLTRLPEVVVSHFLSWTYQASTPEEIEAVARLVESSIQRGLESIRCEQICRSGGAVLDASNRFDLTPYSDAQLEQGRVIYDQAFAGGTWRMTIESNELVFCR